MDLALEGRAVNILRACERQALFVGYVSTRVSFCESRGLLGEAWRGGGWRGNRLTTGSKTTMPAMEGTPGEMEGCSPPMSVTPARTATASAHLPPLSTTTAGWSAQGVQLHPQGPLGGHRPTLHTPAARRYVSERPGCVGVLHMLRMSCMTTLG